MFYLLKNKKFVIGFLLVICVISTSVFGLVKFLDSSAKAQNLNSNNYTTTNGVIFKNNQPIQLRGINWFGFETDKHSVGGLATPGTTYKQIISSAKRLGFNAVRLPFCPISIGISAGGISAPVQPINVSTTINPDLADPVTGRVLNSAQIFDIILNELNNQGMYILLDHHTIVCDISGAERPSKWYSSAFNYTESDWINTLKYVTERYSNLEYLMGIDLMNEPHTSSEGAVYWGSRNPTDDWKLAAEKAGEAVLSVNPNILIFIEGVAFGSVNPDINPPCILDGPSSYAEVLMPVRCFPIDIAKIPKNKQVFSPHFYGPGYFNFLNQPNALFTSPAFPNTVTGVLDRNFGYLTNQNYTVVPGEFGGAYDKSTPKDKIFQDKVVDYLITKKICNFFYFTLNAELGSFGFLKSDYQSPQTGKYQNLKRLMNDCQTQTDIDPVDTECSLFLPCTLPESKARFNLPTLSVQYQTQTLQLLVDPGIYSSAPRSGSKYVCRIQLRSATNSDGNDIELGWEANVSRLSGGVNPTKISTDGSNNPKIYQVDYNNSSSGCSISLEADQQAAPKLVFEVKVVELNNLDHALGNIYQLDESYHFLFGATGSVGISV